MKTFIATILCTLFSVSAMLAQPAPNQNPFGNATATTSGPTQNSISTLSTDYNSFAWLVIAAVFAAAIVYVSNVRKVRS